VMPADVGFGPVTAAVHEIVAADDGEQADTIATLAAHTAGAKREAQLHRLPAQRRILLHEEADPRPTRTARIGLDHRDTRFAHNTPPAEGKGAGAILPVHGADTRKNALR